MYIDHNAVPFMTCEYANTFENSKKNFPEEKLDRLGVTVQRIFEKNLTKSDVNSAVWEKVTEIWEAFNTTPLHLHFHVCTNKEPPTASAQKRFQASMSKYQLVHFSYVGQDDFVSRLLQQQFKKVDGDIQFIGTNHFSKNDGHVKGTVATISALDLVELVRNPDDKTSINESVFNDNIRVDLGLNNKINRAIYDSARSETNFEFWYMNNGITIVCDECGLLPRS